MINIPKTIEQSRQHAQTDGQCEQRDENPKKIEKKC